MTFNLSRLSIGVTLAIFLGSCDNAASTQTLIIGDWKQVKAAPVSSQGIAMEVSGTSMRYLSDGTSISGSTLTIENVPDSLAAYKLASEGTWRIEDGRLYERITDAKVNGLSGNPQAAIIARQMEDTLENADESAADILALTDTQMTVKNSESGLVLRFERQ